MNAQEKWQVRNAASPGTPAQAGPHSHQAQRELRGRSCQESPTPTRKQENKR